MVDCCTQKQCDILLRKTPFLLNHVLGDQSHCKSSFPLISLLSLRAHRNNSVNVLKGA